MKQIFIVAPDGQAGGGMGRVKDYILAAGDDRNGQYRTVPMITRDGQGAVYSLWLLLKAVLTIICARLKGEAGLVHVNFGDNGSAFRKTIIVLAARAVGVPVLLHLHAVELERQYAVASPVLKWLIRWPFRAANIVVVLGERWRRWLSEDLGVDNAKIEILWNGVPVPPHAPRAFPVAPERAQLLFLGNLLERKGMSDLLAALAALSPDTRPWQAVIAGGGDMEKYQAYASELGIADNVTFVGWVEQDRARTLLAESDMMALPSYEEGLPLVILEALGMGTPVICTPVGSIPEVLADGETALFCEPGDRPELSRRIAQLIASPELCTKLSMQGSARFEQLFSLQAFQTSLFDIYQRRLNIAFSASR